MSRNRQSEKQNMTAMQKQAVLVCVICVLAALLTISITVTLLKKGKTPSASSTSGVTDDATDGEGLSGHYHIDQTSEALLGETADAGTEYQDDTLFLGDSNTVRLYNNGLISLQQFCAKEGIGTQAALNDGIVTFKGDKSRYTIAQAVAKMKPRRVVMTFGTNDADMEVQDFIDNYTALVQAIQESYPYTDIIVNTVPPIPEDHSSYPHMDQTKIDDFNMALLSMCEQLGVKFLNTAETLKGEDGYGKADYYTDGDIHLKSSGLKAALTYLRTHAYQTEDRRPDTSNIPIRTMEYVSNPSSVVTSSVETPSVSESTSESSSESVSSSSESTGVQFEAHYRVEKSGGGTLSTGDSSGNNSVSYKVNDPDKSITVTAVPEEGHVFVKWSDGVTSKTRTDSNFKQNVDVTAIFGTASVRISSEGHPTLGSTYTFKAFLNGKYASAENLHWYANGEEITAAAGMTSIVVRVDASMLNTSYKIHAAIVYNGSTVNSNNLTVSVGGGGAASESTASSSSHAGASSGSTSTSGSASSGSSSTSSSSSGTSSASNSSSSSSASTSENRTGSSSASKAESKAESSSGAESHSASASESKAESKTESQSPSTSSAENDAASSSEASSSEASASKEAASTAE